MSRGRHRKPQRITANTQKAASVGLLAAILPLHYTVQTGDTLSGIATTEYGNPGFWVDIYDANREIIGSNPNLIRPGEVLLIPRASYKPRHAVLADDGPLSGTLTCGQLRILWEDAGGSFAEAFVASEIAEAESGGRQYATGAAGEKGYWQINPDHGALSTYNPLGNARAAVIISDDGTNWSPWTTYTSGLYIGRC